MERRLLASAGAALGLCASVDRSPWMASEARWSCRLPALERAQNQSCDI